METDRGDTIYTESVMYSYDGQPRDAYLARPSGDGPFPALVVIHEVYGLNDNIREIAKRFAREGYVALAVDLFGPGNRALCVIRVVGGLRLRPLDNGGVSQLRAALSYVEGLPGVDANRLGAAGFCMGGGYAVAWSCSDSRLRAIAPFYASNPRPLSAVRKACPVVGSYPAQDFTAKAGRSLDAALTEYGIPHDIKIYPGAKHSFMNDQRSAFNAEAAADSWRRMLAFFAECV